MGFANLIEHMTVVNWIVFIVLIIMSVLSIYWIIYNFFKHIRLKKNTDRVIATFWETPNAQDAIRFMAGIIAKKEAGDSPAPVLPGAGG